MALGSGIRGGFSLRRGNERFEKEREKFRQIAKEDVDLAYDVGGIAMVHSLTIEDGSDVLERFGFEAKEAVDFYNRGVVAAQAEDFPKAIEQFRKAAEVDSSLLDAIYNLAVCYERTKQIPPALSTWQTYLDSIKDKVAEDEVAKIKNHIVELKAKQK